MCAYMRRRPPCTPCRAPRAPAAPHTPLSLCCWPAAAAVGTCVLGPLRPPRRYQHKHFVNAAFCCHDDPAVFGYRCNDADVEETYFASPQGWYQPARHPHCPPFVTFTCADLHSPECGQVRRGHARRLVLGRWGPRGALRRAHAPCCACLQAALGAFKSTRVGTYLCTHTRRRAQRSMRQLAWTLRQASQQTAGVRGACGYGRGLPGAQTPAAASSAWSGRGSASRRRWCCQTTQRERAVETQFFLQQT